MEIKLSYESPFQKILKLKPHYARLIWMLEDDSKLGKDETYDALKNVLKAKLLDEFPKQAREAREELQALETTP